ncbi:hypothetical protein CWE11_04555 [Aliidiomarina sanyensis]|uniref:Polymerase/histidinol phosphatase N-terminal domain-containing protein n=1 Tax=Aliidiomarina sanyensis TaxID=1249555 RepID=A0A432WNT4_9GAMM|nr:hypothetical protein CWE11_04555 [Aliidiomarina sanyensis]
MINAKNDAITQENVSNAGRSSRRSQPFVAVPPGSERIDLHCHSRCSDGALHPHELLLRAENMQIDVLAITDHDSIAGYQAAQRVLAEQRAARVVLIPGVEISTRWEGFEIHILGWNFDPEAPRLTALLTAQANKRRERSVAIHGKLLKQGIPAEDLPDPHQQPRDAVLTRLHFAEALVKARHCKDIQSAFDRYLGRGQCAYVASQWCSVEEAVEAIRASGGVAGLAHPLAYGLSNKWLRRLLVELKACGAEALEAVSSQQAPWQRQWLLELANEYGFYVSMGSDFHAPGKYRELGRNLKYQSEVAPVWTQWSKVENG